MIYGTPSLRIDTDETDRIGIRTVVMSRIWQASRWPMTLDELDAEAPETPETPSGMEFVARRMIPGNGVLRTAWGFHGVHGNGKDVTFKTRANSPDYGFSPGFAQVDIALHPKLQQLLDTYEGYPFDGEINFPPKLTGDTGSAGLSGGTASNAGKANPMFGVKDFLRMEGTYSFRYATGDKSGIGNGEGRIFQSGGLPGDPPSYTGRNWLKAPTQWQRRGPIFEVIESYWLSGDGGWPKPVYGAIGSGAQSSPGLVQGDGFAL